MSRRTATDSIESPRNQRVRFDATSAQAGTGDPTRATQTPIALADSFVKKHVMSLQPQLASILEKLGLQHVALLHKLQNKKVQITRMEGDEEFIPRSARIDFGFHMSKRAEERPEFLALQEETNSHITDFRKFLRQQIIKATRIEMTTLTEEIQVGYSKAIRLATEAFLVSDDTCSSQPGLVHSAVSTMMDAKHEILLRHSTFDSYAAFCECYKRTHNIPTFPIARPTAAANRTATGNSRFFAGGASSSQTNNSGSATPPPTHNLLELDKISRALESVFVTPFDEYIKQCKKNAISLHLKKISTAHFHGEATDATQMELDREPAIDRSQLQSLIKKHTQAETKNLSQEVMKLQQKLKNLESKNSRRGPSPRPGASSTKKVRTPPTKQQKNNKQRSNQRTSSVKKDASDPAGESNNASTRNKGRSKKRRNLNSTGRKNARSATGRNR
jgi:hypothetical protein